MKYNTATLCSTTKCQKADSANSTIEGALLSDIILNNYWWII